jgi:hypothetical protein
VHCIVPGGGIKPDGSTGLTAGGKWVNCRPGFFLPVRVLSKVFRGKFIDLLKSERSRGLLVGADDQRRFDQLLDAAVKHDWVVHAKPPFGGPEQVLKYLARYTHRIAISNRRLVSVDNQSVTFNYKDYAHGNRPRTMTLDGGEFLRRFLMHAVPTGFMRIRHFGLLANRVRAKNLALCRRLMSAPPPANSPTIDTAQICPICQCGRMISGPNLDPMQLHRLMVRLDSS